MTRDKFKKLIKEAYLEVLLEQEVDKEELEAEDEEEAPEGAVLKDGTEDILEKFPTVKKILTKMMTSDFNEFVENIEWVSPKPTTFKIGLKNGQDFTITWQGKNFDANILGKDYYLGKVNEFQQALDKLAVLYQEAPMVGSGEEEGGLDKEFGDGGGGSGGGADFPGEEDAGAGAEFDEPEGGEEEGGEDLSDEEMDFEEPETT